MLTIDSQSRLFAPASGSRVNLGYDTAGRMASLAANPVTPSGTGTDLSTTLPLLSAAAYNGANDLVGWTWGDASAYARSFDVNGRLVSYPLGLPSGNGAAAGVTRTLSYDNGLGITGYAHQRGSVAQSALDQSFAYDALDRLTSASVAGTGSGYGYDATSNRTRRTINGSNYANAIEPASNRLASVQSPGPTGTVSATYVHDAAGNLTQDPGSSYAYGDRGRMSSATVAAGSVSYLTNGMEQRVMKAGPTSLVATGAMYFVHDEQGRLLGQYDANLTPIHETAYFGDAPVAVLKTTGSRGSNNLQVTPHYVYADQINTPRVITRASDQAIVWRWDQAEAFGASQPDDNPSGIGAFRFDQRFPGQVYDAETGNHDNWHRTYRPSVGRYDSYDPIGLAGGINPYTYVESNPVSYVDPDGLQIVISIPGRRPGGVRDPDFPPGVGPNQSPSTWTWPNWLKQCPPDNECDKLNADVQRAKSRVGSFQPAACSPGMSRGQLQARASAWLDLAVARAKRDQKCWAGGDEGHQQAQADAWKNLSRCQGLVR